MARSRRKAFLSAGSAPKRGSLVLAVALLLVAADIAAGLARVASCDSVRTSQCVGGVDQHLLLFIGLAGILAGWGLGVAHSGETRPLTRATVRFALLVVPLVGLVAWFFADELLNPSDGSWDGRPVAIRLALLVIAPAALTLAAGARNRGRCIPLIGLTVACVAISYILPFAVTLALLGFAQGPIPRAVEVAVLFALVLAAWARSHRRHRGRPPRV